MSRVDNRLGLRKFLSKDMVWQGVVHSLVDGKMLLKDISVKGKSKVLAEHIWIDDVKAFRAEVKRGDIIQFDGIATNYKDSHGVRKYNISKICKLGLVSLAHDAMVKQGEHDDKYKGIRYR